jgi:small subunit ribosomal protein S15
MLHRIESKIKRLSRYYARMGTIPENWKYDPKEAELLIKGKG